MPPSKDEARDEILKLARFYNMNKKKFDKDSETDTRSNFIDWMLQHLGWDVFSREIPDEVQRENLVKTSDKGKKKADYILSINGVPKIAIEAKAFGEDLENRTFQKQAIEYAYNKACSWAVLTNFKEVKLFFVNRKNTYQPFYIIQLDNIQKFSEEFEYLWKLSKDSIKNGELRKDAIRRGIKKEKIAVDKQLFEDLREWRKILSKDIKKRYSDKYDAHLIDEIVQRIIARLIFIRKTEDGGMEERQLDQMTRKYHESTYDELKKIFLYYNEHYDSKIFGSGKKDLHETDQINISNGVIEAVIKGMYTPKGSDLEYNFDAIDADVLGNIYEQYLAFVLSETPKTTKLKGGIAHRKEQGIYYTPTYIVDYIVKNTLGEMLKEKSAGEIKNIKILDPACGSGSFLIKAFDYLLKYHQSNGKNNTLEDFTRKISILKDNLHGIDLDARAVEIAQLNLLLKALQKGKTLPMLQNNIKVGNSLIDDEKIAGNKAFNWNKEFKEIIENGGFDVIIGNPPYVRIQTLDKDQVEYFNKNYKSATKNYDIYILFIEKGLSLLKENGVLGLILPHKFFQGEMGEKIRRYIYETKSLYKIVDFTTNQIFEGATTYTCLLFLSKRQNNHFFYRRFRLGENFKNLQNIEFEKRDIEILKNDKWNFSDSEVQKILIKIFHHRNRFTAITKKIFKGSSTGADDIFLLDHIKENDKTFTVFSKRLNENIEIEKDLIRPFVYGEDVRRYMPVKSKKLLLFPYVLRNGKVKLIPIEEMKQKYPLTYAYLNKLKNDLTRRKVKTDSSNFYKYSAARSLIEYAQPKIMIPDMLVSNRISYDEKGVFYHGPAIHSVVFNEKVKEQNPLLYLAILNSKLFWFFISNTSTALRGNAYRLTPEFLNPFCFPVFDLNKIKDRETHDKIVTLVEGVFSLNKRLDEIGDMKTDARRKTEEEIKRIDKEIDQKVYELYGLTPEEIKIVKESIKD